MAELLSSEWFDSLEQRLATAAVDADLELVIEQVVEHETEVRYQVHLADGQARLDRDATGTPDATVRTDFATAAGILDGSVSAQRAFLDGSLRIGGDVAALMANRSVLAGLFG